KILVTGGTDKGVNLWEVRTGKLIRALLGHEGGIVCVTCSPEGKTFASASGDSTVLVWDMAIQAWANHKRQNSLTTKELQRIWLELGEENAAPAYEAMGALIVASDKAAGFLQERIRANRVPDNKQVQDLLAKLNDRRFAVREQATRDLTKISR